MKTFVIILLSLFLIGASFAQVPQLVNYQGKLDSAGVPLNGTRNLTFNIYNVLTAGTAIWTETQAGATITNGVFNVILGSVSPFSSATSPLFVGTGDRYIGITVGSGTEMTPRLKITSVAYSLRAAQADSVADNSITSAKISDGTVATADIASNAVTSAKILDGTIAAADIAAGAIGSSAIAAGAVATAQIADNSITTTKIVDGTITSADIADGTVAAADLASNSVTTIKIADNNVTAAKIADEPGVGHSFSYGGIALTTTYITADSVILNCPSAGFVVVNAYGFFYINHTNGTSDIPRVSISSTPATIDFDNFAIETYNAALPTAGIYRSFSLTKVEAVTAGINKYYLNADVYTGNSSIERRHLTAIFFPTAYGTVVSTKQGLTPPDGGISPAGIR